MPKFSSSRLRSVVVVCVALFGLTAALPGTSSAATKKVVSKARFKAKLDASSLTVARNSSSNVTVLVTRVGSFEGPIRLSSSTRKGLKVTFDENPLLGDDTDLIVEADNTANITSTTLTVSASDGKTTAKLLLKVRVTAAGPAAAAATPSPVTTIATTTTASTTTTPGATTTTAGPTTTAGATTTIAATSTTVAGTTTTVGAASAVGDVVITRKVSQAQPCAKGGIFADTVVVSLSNTGTSARLLSTVAPGTCVETPIATPIQPGALASLKVVPGSLIVARSQATTGNPIRTVLFVARTSSFDVSGSMTVLLSCVGVATAPPFSLADGAQFVITVPAGSSCRVVTADQNSVSVTDNSGVTTDGSAQVPGRPAACPVAKVGVAVPGPAGCYAEFVVTT